MRERIELVHLHKTGRYSVAASVAAYRALAEARPEGAA